MSNQIWVVFLIHNFHSGIVSWNTRIMRGTVFCYLTFCFKERFGHIYIPSQLIGPSWPILSTLMGSNSEGMCYTTELLAFNCRLFLQSIYNICVRMYRETDKQAMCVVGYDIMLWRTHLKTQCFLLRVFHVLISPLYFKL